MMFSQKSASRALHSGLIVLFPGQHDKKTCGHAVKSLYDDEL